MLRSGAYSDVVAREGDALRSVEAVILDDGVAVGRFEGRCTDRW